MIELLVVLGIIALLVGLLLPAVSAVKKMAKETKQKAQFVTIELALEAFKNDYGDYPPSDWFLLSPHPSSIHYCGSQRLAEALLGWDLLGFHPNSAWREDGLDVGGVPGHTIRLKQEILTAMVFRTLSTRGKVLTWSLRMSARSDFSICLRLTSYS